MKKSIYLVWGFDGLYSAALTESDAKDKIEKAINELAEDYCMTYADAKRLRNMGIEKREVSEETFYELVEEIV